MDRRVVDTQPRFDGRVALLVKLQPTYVSKVPQNSNKPMTAH